jgi:omega-amidase
MRVAAAQISCLLGDRAANLRKVRGFASRAKRSGAQLVVFPEMVDTGYSMPTIKQHAAAWKGGAVPELQKIAKELGLGIVCGISDRDGESIYNAQVFVNASGNTVAKYRKTHLVTAAPLDERLCFSPGNEFVSCAIDPAKDESAVANKLMPDLPFATISDFQRCAGRSWSNTT